MTADTINAADIRINARWLIPIEPANTVLDHQACLYSGTALPLFCPRAKLTSVTVPRK